MFKSAYYASIHAQTNSFDHKDTLRRYMVLYHIRIKNKNSDRQNNFPIVKFQQNCLLALNPMPPPLYCFNSLAKKTNMLSISNKGKSGDIKIPIVMVFSFPNDYSESNIFYRQHANITCLAWSPVKEHFASCGMYMIVYVWALNNLNTRVKIQDAHQLHHISLAWLVQHTLLTISHNCLQRTLPLDRAN